MVKSGNAHLWQEAGAAVSARNGGPADDSTPVAGAQPGRDRLTILTTFGALATKALGPGPDGRLTVRESYGRAEHFRCATALVHGLAEIASLLERLATCRRSFVIRGELLPGADARRCQRHYKKEPITFRERPRRWLMVDADDVPEPPGASMLTDPEDCVEHVLGRPGAAQIRRAVAARRRWAQARRR